MESLKEHLVKLCAAHLTWSNTRLHLFIGKSVREELLGNLGEGGKNILACPLTPFPQHPIHQQPE